jgi:hypothetical protein
MKDMAAEDGVVTARRLEDASTVTHSRRGFPREKPWPHIGMSILVLLPCFWHQRIEAGDLGSHTYNSWLAQLIERGQAPGLYTVQQWNNVLADIATTRVARVLGFTAAEKIVVGISVLIFFWGAFAFIKVATRRAPWFLVPGIAMVAYGWTFQMGFLNYYLSVGLAFCATAIFWRGRKGDWVVGLALAGLAMSAHLMGFFWLAGTAVYIKLAGKMPRGRWLLLIVALMTILGVHFYVPHTYRVFDPVSWHVYRFLGFDQLVVYGRRYRVPALIALLLGLLIAILGTIRERNSGALWRTIQAPLELWGMTVFATAMLWDRIMIPRYATGFSYIPSRFSSITAILGLCVLGCVTPRKWHLVAFAACAVVFFAWMYQDTGRVNGMEEQAENLVGGLPYGTRVIQTIFMPPGSRVAANHILDRACIGRCFSYGNYEPASRQFRIRAKPGNSIVAASSESSVAMQHGKYIVRPEDLPLAEIYQCDDGDLTKLCMRNLYPGEVNGRLGYHPPK